MGSTPIPEIRKQKGQQHLDGTPSMDLWDSPKIQCWCQIFPEDPPGSLSVVFKANQQTKNSSQLYVDTFYHNALYLDMCISH